MKPTNILLIAIVLLLFVQSAGAYNVNGTVTASDTNSGLSGVTVTLNSTNTTTTNATGFFSLPDIANGTATLAYKAAGYTAATNSTTVSDADNTTNNQKLTIITPAVSGVAISSITNTGATITWTVTATDGANNNYVGNRILYSEDSALVNGLFYTSWSNNTASPSLTLSNLDLGKTWYFRVQTYNSANSSYSATSDSSFATTHGKDPNAYYKQFATPTPAFVPAEQPTTQQGGALSSGAVTGGTTGTPNRTFIGFVVIVLVGVIVVMWLKNSQSSKGKKSKRK